MVLQFLIMALVFTAPAFVFPAIIGPLILRFFASDPIRKVAGILVLKPLVATPLVALLFALQIALDWPEGLNPLLTVLPGIGLTVAIVWAFRGSFKTDLNILLVFLGADALRWLNALNWAVTGRSLGSPNYPAGLIITNLYAVMALVILWVRARRHRLSMRSA